MLTLNQTTEILKNFSSKHKALKGSFYFGDEWESQSSNELNYPNMHVVLQSSSVNDNTVSNTFRIIISDLVNNGETNETHVLSDTQLICIDLLNYLEQVSDSGDLGGFTVIKTANLTDFTESREDDVSGWFFDLTLNSSIDFNSCNLPIEDGNILDNNYIYINGSYEQTCGDFQVLIKDQDGNVLQTFTTNGEYVVTVLNGIKDTITSNVTTITDDII